MRDIYGGTVWDQIIGNLDHLQESQSLHHSLK